MAEKKNNEQQLYVQKEPFEYNGKMYNHYYIKGVVRGREVKIDRPHGGRGRQSLRMHGQALAHVGQVAS